MQLCTSCFRCHKAFRMDEVKEGEDVEVLEEEIGVVAEPEDVSTDILDTLAM